MISKMRFARISAILLLVAILLVTVSACNFLDGVTKITNVTIEATSGLVDSNGDGVYEIESGKEFTLTAKWGNVLIDKPNIKWFVAINDGEKQQLENETSKTLTQTIVGAVGTRYAISCSANSVESASALQIVIKATESGGGEEPEPQISFNLQVTGVSDANGNGFYEAKYSKSFTVSANLTGILAPNPQFDWYVKEDGVERKLAQTSASITFTIESREIQRYEFRAVYDGTDGTNVIKVEFVDSTLETPVISCSSHTLAQGIVQQNVVEEATNVSLSVDWNSDEIPADLVTIAWFVDGEKESEVKDFVFNVGGISSACEKTVRVSVTYKGHTESAEITLSFIEEYQLVESVSIGVDTTGEVNAIDGLKSAYRVSVPNSSTPVSVNVTANILPLDANLGADCTWTVRKGAGTVTHGETTSDATISLSYGKNVITVTAENVASRSVIVYVLTDADYSARENAITSQFVWDGSVQDHYINNQEELNIFIGYLVATHETSNGSDSNVHTVYLAPSEWRDGAKVSDAFTSKDDDTTALAIAMQNGIDESGHAQLEMSGNTKIYLSSSSMLGEANGALETTYTVTQQNVYVRYSSIPVGDRRAKLPVDDFAETMLVKNSNQLTRALMWGYKPTFENNANGTALQTLYNKARNMLLEYVSEEMSELDKVGVIFDWIVKEVDYDYEVYYSTVNDGSQYSFNAYFLEGVFDDHRAVCDGKSKAFALLCGMEGIKALRIIGTADGGGHAWNKVLIDANGDGVREWYIVDTTWGDTGMGNTKDVTEILTYQYFLKTDEFMSSTHESSMAQPVANTEFDVYSNTYINEIALYLTRVEDVTALVNYSKTHGSVEIRCKFAPGLFALRPYGTQAYNLVGDESNVYYIYGE